MQVIADSKLIGTGHRPADPYYLLSCDELDSGCNTGNMATAYAWIQVQQHGILSVEDFPTASDWCMEAESNEKAKGGPSTLLRDSSSAGAETVCACSARSISNPSRSA